MEFGGSGLPYGFYKRFLSLCSIKGYCVWVPLKVLRCRT